MTPLGPAELVRRAAEARPELAPHAQDWLAENRSPPHAAPDPGQRRAAAQLIAPHRATLAASPAPITIEGANPPWILLEVHAATDAPHGYRPGIRLVQADPLELIEGCAAADLTAVLADPRVELFIGPNAHERLADAIAAEPDTAHAGPVIVCPAVRTRTAEPVQRTIAQAVARLDRRRDELADNLRADDHHAGHAARLERLRRPALRVALIAGRFTTVLRPMTEDLARALHALGHHTRIITEPSDHRRITPLAYARALHEHRPDLIIAANHTRDDIDRILGDTLMPRTVPWVTWIQDSLPHLLTPHAGRAIGPLDLAIGHITPEMIQRLCYPPARTIAAPMVASDTTFDPGAIDQRLIKRFACEAAAFTNHSETPEAMHRRLIDEVSGSSAAARLVDAIAREALALAQQPAHLTRAADACRTIVASLAPDADDATAQNLRLNVAMRLLDRARRHSMLRTAAQTCARDGWRLRLFGRGWEAHPDLAHLACGALDYHTELPAAYAAAALTLHASEFAPMHQRLIECALAGGLPAITVSGDALALARERLRATLVTEHRRHAVPYTNNGQHFLLFPVYRCEQAASFAQLRALASPPGVARSYPYTPVWDGPINHAQTPPEADAHHMLDLTTLGFTDADSLGRLIRRAVTDPAWRSECCRRIAARARASCTHTALARRILDHYADRSHAHHADAA